MKKKNLKPEHETVSAVRVKKFQKLIRIITRLSQQPRPYSST